MEEQNKIDFNAIGKQVGEKHASQNLPQISPDSPETHQAVGMFAVEVIKAAAKEIVKNPGRAALVAGGAFALWKLSEPVRRKK